MWGATWPVFANIGEQAVFQSTLPVWGATVSGHQEALSLGVFQSTLPVWGATQGPPARVQIDLFQSTLPVWGATAFDNALGVFDQISIHAPRVGSDKSRAGAASCRRYFNPRSPCGERLGRGERFDDLAIFQSTLPVWGATPGTGAKSYWVAFQSTLPVWGATISRLIVSYTHKISIHAPRVGSDQRERSSQTTRHYFNPRSPCGERQ